MTRRLLILGGTTEATLLSTHLAGDRRIDATFSLAGRTDTPAKVALPMRIGGFGGVPGLCEWLREHRIHGVIDATHPFAAQMSANASEACALEGVARLRFTRPPWEPVTGDEWTIVDDLQAAVVALGDKPRRVFLPIGRNSLAPFAAAPQHHYLVRSIESPADLSALPHHETVLARPPFAVSQECDLLREHRIDVLVAKNSGGKAASAKLEAARRLRLPVVMVRRPVAPAGRLCHNLATALTFALGSD